MAERLPDPHGVIGIKTEMRQSLEDFCNSQTPVGLLCIAPDDLTKLLNDHDALTECVAYLAAPPAPRERSEHGTEEHGDGAKRALLKLSPQLGDEPIEAAYREQMTAVAQALDETFNGEAKGQDRKVGFVLLVFPFGEGEGRCNYISNGADRRDMVTLLKEQIKRFEGQPEMEGRA